MAFDRTKSNCSLCRPAKCTCDAKTYALEKEANRWAKATAGEALPLDTTGRLLGGSHERRDRGDPQDHLARLVEGKRDQHELTHYLEVLTTRLGAMRNAENVSAAERPGLEIQVRALAMHVEGKSLQEISAALGRKSHSFACDLLARVRDEASAMYSQRGSVATPCKCGKPGCIIMGFTSRGRPRLYRTPACANMARYRRWMSRLPRRQRPRRGSSREPDSDGLSVGAISPGDPRSACIP